MQLLTATKYWLDALWLGYLVGVVYTVIFKKALDSVLYQRLAPEVWNIWKLKSYLLTSLPFLHVVVVIIAVVIIAVVIISCC